MRALLDLLFPLACVACAALLDRPTAFCAECEVQLSPVPQPACARCFEPLPSSRPAVLPKDGPLCARCRFRPPPYASAWAPYVHEGPLARAIHRLKYEDHPELADALAGLLAPRTSKPKAWVAAIPLHVSRFRERRYDQAELLAGALARRLGWPHARRALVRRAPTARQVGLTEEEREANVRGAFRAQPRLMGQAVVLVDDVLTTGATARAAAQALLDVGCARVEVVTLARAWSGP